MVLAALACVRAWAWWGGDGSGEGYVQRRNFLLLVLRAYDFRFAFCFACAHPRSALRWPLHATLVRLNRSVAKNPKTSTVQVTSVACEVKSMVSRPLRVLLLDVHSLGCLFQAGCDIFFLLTTTFASART